MAPPLTFHTRTAEHRKLEQDFGQYSLTRVMQALSNDEPLSGFEHEVQAAFGGGQAPGYRYGANITVPWGVLGAGRRDLNVAVPSAGGSLVGLSMGPAADVLRPYNVAARSGMTVLSGLKDAVEIPAVLDEVEFQWLLDEGSTGPSLTPVTGVTTLRPHTACGLMTYPLRLVRNAPLGLIEQFVRRRLLLAAGQLIDTAMLQGGSNRGTPTADDMGEPLGLVNTTGVVRCVGTVAGNSLLSTGINPAMTAVLSRSGSDDGAAWIIGPMMRQLLLPNYASEPGVIDSAGRLQGRPVHCTSAMAANAAAYGDWSTAILALFGNGIDVAIDPFSGFKNNIVTMRCMVTMDVAFPNPAAFAIATIG